MEVLWQLAIMAHRAGLTAEVVAVLTMTALTALVALAAQSASSGALVAHSHRLPLAARNPTHLFYSLKYL